MSELQFAPAGERPISGGSSDEDWLRRFCADRDVACPRCGYNLRGLAEPRCPECGIGIRLTIGASEPYLMRWVISLCALAMPAGVGLLLVSIMITRGRFDILDERGLVATSLVLFLLAVPLLASVWFGRRQFVRRGDRTQRILAACIVSYALLPFVLWILGRGQ